MTIRLGRREVLLGGAALAASAAIAGPARAQEPEFVLKLHHFLGPKAPAQANMLEPWAKRVEEASGGRVKIEIYPSMSLGGTPAELIRQVRDGVVDLVWTVNGYSAGLFPRTEVFELPFIHTNNPIATNLAIAEIFDQYLAEEHQGTKVLFSHVHAGQAFHMVDTVVRKPEDFPGKKLRIPTRTGAWLVEALGASPVSMPVPELTQALQRKVVDGALVPWEIIPAIKLQDLTQYQIEGHDKTRFGTTVFQVSMNGAKWNSLPDDIKKAFTDNSGEAWLREVGQIWRDVDEGGIKVAVDSGNEHITLSQEETKAFEAPLAPVVDRWIADVGGSGVDGAALVAAARAAIAKHSAA